MPLTEDAQNLPTMAQMQLNFGSQNEDKHQSMRSGVFGGFNQS
jgi:hypothetical protein